MAPISDGVYEIGIAVLPWTHMNPKPWNTVRSPGARICIPSDPLTTFFGSVIAICDALSSQAQMASYRLPV